MEHGHPWHHTAMPRAVPVLALAAVLAAAAPRPARAHVAPAIGDNNRYLKLSVLGDRLRLAYTVFYGELPGAALRKAIDGNHDGAIDDAETQPFGERIARDVAAAVDLQVDGVRQPIAWTQVVVGMGTPSAAAGAFSIDLVAAICLAAPRGPHHLLLRDSYRLDRPGETEVVVEDSPGVAITGSHIGGADDEAHDYKLVGPSGALETEGLDVALAIGDRALATPDAVCPGPAAPPTIRPGVAIGAGAAAAIVLAAGGALVVRRRRRGKPPGHAGGKRR